MHVYEAGILRTEHRCGTMHAIKLECPPIASEILPGQFVQVRVSAGTDPFLRRTFSVSGASPDSGSIELLVDTVGRGTELLCSMKRGGIIDIIGPLGTGFDIVQANGFHAVLVGGGSGAAPLIFLADRLSRTKGNRIDFLYGARTESLLRAVTGLPKNVVFHAATDDGSSGYHGFVTPLLETFFADSIPSMVYTCGPLPMMKAVAEICLRGSVRCQVSLEERMACGFGVCLGCTVMNKEGKMIRSCVEGPVFYSDEVVL